jgi:agmatinase
VSSILIGEQNPIWGPPDLPSTSHIDTWDPKVLGGGISHYAGVNHGTFLHIAHEEGLILNSSAHAGIRAPAVNKRYDWKNDKRCGFEIITARDIDHIGINGIVEKLKKRVGDTNVYISVDIDVLDPSHAPATGTAEVGGWTTRELLSILDALEGMKVIGADVVEVAPAYDNAGETTVLAAAEVAHSLLALMIETPVQAVHAKEHWEGLSICWKYIGHTNRQVNPFGFKDEWVALAFHVGREVTRIGNAQGGFGK